MERVILLTGKLYYELAKERNARGLEEKVALIRIEELCPFPFGILQRSLAQYSHVRDVCWVQEEPRNQGAWTHVSFRIAEVLERIHAENASDIAAPILRYIGRKEDAVPAVGVGKVYKEQQNAVIQLAFEGL